MRCCASYALGLFGSVHIVHRPMFLSIEPASVCQLRCPACPVGQANSEVARQSEGRSNSLPFREGSGKGSPFMSHDIWQRILSEANPFVHTIQFYFQGEPLLNKALLSMIREAHEAGIYTIVSTNAQALTPELAESLVRSGLNRIIISMDGLTPESYNAYRIGGDLRKCKSALRWLKEAKQKHSSLLPFMGRLGGAAPLIELQVLRLRSNEHEWKTFAREYKTLGADRLVFKTAQLYDYADGHPLMPSDPQYSRYQLGKDGHYHRKPLSRGCFRAWSGAVITTTGEMLPCCYDKAHAYSFGNIMNTPLTELYNNEKAVTFRKAALKHQHPICQECWK